MLQYVNLAWRLRFGWSRAWIHLVAWAALFFGLPPATPAGPAPLVAAPRRASVTAPLLYFNDTREIRRYDSRTGELVGVFVPPTDLLPHFFSDMAFGPDNNLYVADGLEGKVLRYDGQTGALIDTFIPARAAGLTSAYHLIFGPDGNLYIGGQDISSFATSKVVRYNGATGALIETFIPAISGNQPTVQDMIFGGDGNLYIGAVTISGTNGYVLKYNGTTGELITTLIPPGTASLQGFPWGLTFGPGCSLYLLLGLGIQRFDPLSGAFQGTLAQIAREGRGTQDLALGPDGNFYVSIQSTNEVLRYNAITGAFIDTFVPASQTNGWNSIAFRAPPADLQALAPRAFLPLARAC
jgi:DNA-binding beta-propeller fold protein YncE